MREAHPDPSRAASILHADLDAFYASVEQRDHPHLRGKPVAVGGGVLLAASYEAKRFGVGSPMNEGIARRLCPDLIVVDARMDAYTEASRAVYEIFEDTTPLVEPVSVDEAFLEVAGLARIAGDPTEIATVLRARVKAEVGLNISVGIARTKFLAKVASGVCKPDGLLRVDPNREHEFLHPLPVQRLWGVGQVTAEKLAQKGIYTVGQVAELEQSGLTALLGTASGRHLHALANHEDPRPVVVGKRRSSIGSQRALGRKRREMRELETILLELVERVARRLRDGNRVGRTVTLRFRYADMTRATRSRSLTESTANTAAFLDVARVLLEAHHSRIESDGISLLGFTVANLSDASAIQQPLPFDHRSTAALDDALDAVREKFGGESISRAALTGKPQGLTVPLLPDPV